MKWLKAKDDREYEEFLREERYLDSASPHEHTAYIIGVNTKALLSELRFIRWLLVAILFMAVTFAVYTLPQGWWYMPWWSA